MTSQRPVAAVVLAAGSGKRFRSSAPKVLHLAAGGPLVHHVLRALEGLSVERLLVVVGNGREQVVEVVEGLRPDAQFVHQTELLGTGDAVRRCAQALAGFEGDVLVLPGDGPLLRAATIKALVRQRRGSGAGAAVLTARVEDPTGYGRIVRDGQGRLERIVEEADATPEQRKTDEVSGGVWCFERAALFEALEQIGNENAQGEYYLPDTVLAIRAKGGNIETLMAKDPTEIEGVNDRAQLARAAKEIRLRHLEKLTAAGVSIEDPDTTYIDEGVEIGPDTTILPLTFIKGATQVGSGCSIGPATTVVDSIIEDGAEVTFSVVRESHIGPKATVGPYASLRPGTRLREGAKAGTFVEVKESTIGEGSKVPHLSYIGDAEIGKEVNLGAGTITANYDTENKVKDKTTVEDGAFTGTHTTLVAPVKLGRGSGTGAGAVVTKDVADGEIVVGVPARPMRRRKK